MRGTNKAENKQTNKKDHSILHDISCEKCCCYQWWLTRQKLISLKPSFSPSADCELKLYQWDETQPSPSSGIKDRNHLAKCACLGLSTHILQKIYGSDELLSLCVFLCGSVLLFFVYIIHNANRGIQCEKDSYREEEDNKRREMVRVAVECNV